LRDHNRTESAITIDRNAQALDPLREDMAETAALLVLSKNKLGPAARLWR